MIENSKENHRPPVVLGKSEAAKLSELALGAEARYPQAANLLLTEIERADIRKDDALPPDVVSMMSTVEFVDEGSDLRRTVQLVYPGDANIAEGRVSILTPVGAGLIGLREGQSIAWPDRSGNERLLRILKVSRGPSAG